MATREIAEVKSWREKSGEVELQKRGKDLASSFPRRPHREVPYSALTPPEVFCLAPRPLRQEPASSRAPVLYLQT